MPGRSQIDNYLNGHARHIPVALSLSREPLSLGLGWREGESAQLYGGGVCVSLEGGGVGSAITTLARRPCLAIRDDEHPCLGLGLGLGLGIGLGLTEYFWQEASITLTSASNE